ncbi:hypothetical protein NPX13_g8671 [Xylaria arbuscula]|uniref:Chromo domain-containing protein n=1 Tax=Xylaria arbuscula TaxID=114810 RepID=A0A9W8TJX8_9PEZI|nr:hypothetical protein NPX13_g8671 [Xylaria arbuscula]
MRLLDNARKQQNLLVPEALISGLELDLTPPTAKPSAEVADPKDKDKAYHINPELSQQANNGDNHREQNAAETLYSYWKAQGGRQSVLFHKPKHPLDEMYHVFKVLRHKKRHQGFQLEVQWVGHSTKPHETTMEPETKIQSIAPALLDQYWGRAK